MDNEDELLKKYVYVINKEYQIVNWNSTIQELYPDLRSGDLCYHALCGEDHPCAACPLAPDRTKGLLYYNKLWKKWLDCTAAPINWNGDEDHRVIICQAVYSMTQLQKQEALKWLKEDPAEFDRLTGLYKRELFLEQVETMMKVAKPGEYCMIALDVENFKLYNTWYGFRKGDSFLKFIGHCMKEITQEEGLAGYMGEDDFAALIPNRESLITELAERLKYYIDSKEESIGFYPAIGVYVIRDLTLRAAAVYDKAATARAFLRGNYMSRISWYDGSMIQEMEKDYLLLNEIKKGIEREEFIFYLQPKCNINTGEIIGMEALARWQHPEKGLLMPGSFIGEMEENGLITSLDLYIWEKVFQLMNRWLEEGRPVVPISINVDRVDLMTINVMEEIRRLAEIYKLPRELIEVEITESTYAENSLVVKRTAEQLRKLGFQVSMDDFGRGYSSLNMLKSVNVDVLKIDMGFMEADEGFEEKGMYILETVIHMAKGLQMRVIAEGVETEKQKRFLQSLGCCYAQGYLFGRPVPVEEAERLLKEQEGLYGNDERQNISGLEDGVLPFLELEHDLETASGQVQMERDIQKRYEKFLSEIFDEVIRLNYKDYTGEAVIQDYLDALKKRWQLTMESKEAIKRNLYPEQLKDYFQTHETEHLDLNTVNGEKLSMYLIPDGRKGYTAFIKDWGNPHPGQLLTRIPMLIIMDYNVETDTLYVESGSPQGNTEIFTFREFLRTIDQQERLSADSARPLKRVIGKAVTEAKYGIVEYKANHMETGMHWYRLRYLSLADQKGRVYRIIGISSNIEEERKTLNAWKELASRDMMTGLLNHDMAYQYIGEALNAAGGGALILVDIDDFKKINDTIGHIQGDEFIKRVAAALKGTFRDDDLLGRVGGDEFIVFMPGMISREVVRERTEDLLEAVEQIQVPVVGKVRCSVGIACVDRTDITVQELFRQADYAMYEAKNGGKGHYVVIENGKAIHQTVEASDEKRGRPEKTGSRKEKQLVGELFMILYQAETKEQGINKALAWLGKALDVSRVYIIELEDEGKTGKNTYEWCAPGITQEIENLQHLNVDELEADLKESFDENDIRFCPDVALLPQNLRSMLEAEGIRSLLHWAFRKDGKIAGIIGIDECRDNIVWNSTYASTLKRAGAVISEYLRKY